MATRPTSDRVREALFSILGNVVGAQVLDLYAGTGALGIEALSRGATHATFVESEAHALRALRRNVTTLALETDSTIFPLSVERALSSARFKKAKFDIVFMDPPYAEVRKGAFTRGLVKALRDGFGSVLKPGARVVLEHASTEEPPSLPGVEVEATRTYGDTSLSFYIE
jgi:16S rRNA (guanine(966)-N(2))-methyltransferase RsmD